MKIIISTLIGTLRTTFPLAIPSLGEAVSERSGVYNIGIEGYMLMGAISAYLGASITGNLWLGVAIGMLAGAVLSLVHAYLSITLKASQIISGMAIWLFSMGFSAYLYRTVGIIDPIDGFSDIQIPVLSELPIVGPILFQQNVLFYIGIFLVFVFVILLFRTRFGLVVRATGDNPLAVDIAGHNVYSIRYISVLISGAMSGLGGAYLTLAILHRFAENISSGRGFIALAIVIFGGWSPWPMLGGALLFAGVDALGLSMQVAKVPVPYPLLLMLPYVVTVVVLVIIAGIRKKVIMPRKLTIPYIKGEA